MRARLLAAAVFFVGCPRPADGPPTADHSSPPPQEADPSSKLDTPPENVSDPHQIVFADRTSQGYLLLVDSQHEAPIDREQLGKLVKDKLAGADEPEMNLLLELVSMEPQVTDPKLIGQPNDGTPRQTSDLLGLHLDVLAIRGSDEPLIATEQLTDPVLTRELSAKERASLAGRRKALLLRADYRNRFGVRGLRLLQTIVRLVATQRGALIFDPDTGETMGVEAFTRRRLRSSLGNIADQVAVVPYPDPRNGDGRVRLATRGMRRFGSVDIELDGLPRDHAALQQATHLLYGLAYRLVRLGEFDETGYAVELDEMVTIELTDIVRAYGNKGAEVPRCESCPRKTIVHLVERDPEPQDPRDHVVARVIAPRSESETKAYNHTGWVGSILEDLFG